MRSLNSKQSELNHPHPFSFTPHQYKDAIKVTTLTNDKLINEEIVYTVFEFPSIDEWHISKNGRVSKRGHVPNNIMIIGDRDRVQY